MIHFGSHPGYFLLIATTILLFYPEPLGIGATRPCNLELGTWNLRERIEMGLREHVEYLAGELGERSSFRYSNLEQARRYVEESFGRIGYTVGHDTYQVGERVYRNVIVEKKGRDSSEKIFVIGAHYDTASGTPGADDNASGVASLLELARLTYPLSSPLTLRFVAFTLEEPPYFRTPHMGSRVHARKSKQRKDRIVGMASLEMVGYYDDRPGSQRFPLPLMRWFYPSEGNFITVAGDFRSRHLVRELTALLARQGEIPVQSVALPLVPGVGLSDNWSFWKEGYLAVMVTDTAFFRNRNYHRPSDLPPTLHYPKMASLVSALARVLVQLNP